MLRKVAFSRELLPRVAAFKCGDQPWDIEVSDWIKAPEGKGGAIDDLGKKCDVWLYLNEKDEVVGFSSLGSSNWRYPTANDPRKQISVIPWVAVEARFQGNGYFSQILAHLFFEAQSKTDRLPIIGLYVDPRNRDAIEKYERKGFEEFHQSYKDKGTGVTYKSFISKLPEIPPGATPQKAADASANPTS